MNKKRSSILQNTIVALLLSLAWSACNSSSESADKEVWKGEWRAEWETPPESYPGLTDMEFYMEGSFLFTEDSLTITNNGFEGCIFAIDTLVHTQLWRAQNDTLTTYNDQNTPGMTYQIKYVSDEVIKLQLMEDIFITLLKK